MRQILANQIAAVIGVLVVTLAAVFALSQQPAAADPVAAAPVLVAAAVVMAHPIEGYEDCVACHGPQGRIVYPPNHLGWPNQSCTQCHQPAAPEELVAEGEPAQTTAASSTQAEQVGRGEQVFAAACVQCHAPGGSAPVLDATTLAAYETAQALFAYTQRTMPPSAPGSLSDQQYWDVTAYMLATEGLLPADSVVGPETAGEIVTQ